MQFRSRAFLQLEVVPVVAEDIKQIDLTTDGCVLVKTNTNNKFKIIIGIKIMLILNLILKQHHTLFLRCACII